MTESKTRNRFDELVREHARLMASAIRRVCSRRHHTLVPDVEQEVYLALWKRLQSGKEINFPTSYLYKVALTTALAVVRRVEREMQVPEANEEPSLPRAPVPVLAAERRAILRQTLDRLEPDDARALRGYLAGFNHVEVAELYGWSHSVARHRIYRTLERLRAESREARGEIDETSNRR